MFGLFGGKVGKHFCNEIADYLGIERKLFSSGLLERGTTHFHIKTLKEMGTSTEEAAKTLLPTFCLGLEMINGKFGPLPEIQAAADRANYWIEQWTCASAASESGSRIISSEFPAGRYELSYPIPEHTETYVMLSDDCKALQGIALVKSLGGEAVRLTDTKTGQDIEIMPDE